MGKIEKWIKKFCSTTGKVSYEKTGNLNSYPDYLLGCPDLKYKWCLLLYTYENSNIELLVKRDCISKSPILVYHGLETSRVFLFITKFFTGEVIDIINASSELASLATSGINYFDVCYEESVFYVLKSVFPDYDIKPYWGPEESEYLRLDPTLEKRLRHVLGQIPYIEYDWLGRTGFFPYI